VMAAVGGAVATAAIVVASTSPGAHATRGTDVSPRITGSAAAKAVALSKSPSPLREEQTARSDITPSTSRSKAPASPAPVSGSEPAARSKVAARYGSVDGTPVSVPVVVGGAGVGATGKTGVRQVKTVAHLPTVSGTGQDVRKVLKTAVAGVQTSAANIEKTIVNTAKSLGDPLEPVPTAAQASAQAATQGAVQTVAQAVSVLSAL
jgi:hypothetical protein